MGLEALRSVVPLVLVVVAGAAWWLAGRELAPVEESELRWPTSPITGICIAGSPNPTARTN